MSPATPRKTPEEQLTQVDLRFRALIDEAVRARLEAAKIEREATARIAQLCVEAFADGVKMTNLAAWVRVLGADGRPRSVTRQNVDLMMAKHEGRPRSTRATRKAQEQAATNGGEKSGVNMSAFE
jgi:hypothetical protein